MKRSRVVLLTLLAAFFAVATYAQFSDVRQVYGRKGDEFIRQRSHVQAGAVPDSFLTFSVGVDYARKVAFFLRANRMSALVAPTCSLAVLQLSQNDTDYVDATSVNGVTVSDNLFGQCFTDSCNNYDRYISVAGNGAARLDWKFARTLVFMKSCATCPAVIDSLRIYCVMQYD